MFGTWKYDPETDEVQNLRRAYDPITARSSQHQACNRCHEKKLKCSGDKNGCDRCASSGHVCVYNRPGSRSSRRGKRTSRPSTNSPSGPREGSGSPLSNVSSPLTRHSSKPRSRPSSSQTQTPAPTAPLAHAGYEGAMLSEADFAMTSQQHMFDMDTLAQGGYTPSSMSHLFSPQQYAAADVPHTQDWAAGAQPMPATTGAGLDQAYLATTSHMYGAGGDFLPYETYPDFDPYQGMDPRYWSQGPQ
ncbi:fungal zn(2)-Cys(6) binuclear cluster domain-containing protein [Hirsutella rhossiliensis]|uniref:Fungal zn(2)-Cys(6) binuclear cluster domain-containing protein n=1 Tax=Hirsutella rhossiliensis TaxID=111463 RepID=A0A9P8N196_9HYPO|nr:fungal zn(2)-Cys(6) binuclear cluster domain-containing protein [Hirsutella rhossiliensis]KAH0966323.1 fungal zn(2)-Cys(6) binuclear cluster domain-containing protein [Hirsutella rhossiliensis]